MSINNTRNIKCHTVESTPNSNIKIVERGILDTPKTQKHDNPLFWPDAGILAKSGGAKLIPLASNLISQ